MCARTEHAHEGVPAAGHSISVPKTGQTLHSSPACISRLRPVETAGCHSCKLVHHSNDSGYMVQFVVASSLDSGMLRALSSLPCRRTLLCGSSCSANECQNTKSELWRAFGQWFPAPQPLTCQICASQHPKHPVETVLGSSCRHAVYRTATACYSYRAALRTPRKLTADAGRAGVRRFQ